MKAKNKGFTLVEVLVTIAVLSMVVLAVGLIINNYANNSSRLMDENAIQEQLADVTDRLKNDIMAANMGVNVWTKDSEDLDWTKTEVTSGDENYILVGLYDLDYGTYILSKSYYLFDRGDNSLMFVKTEEAVERSAAGQYYFNVDPDPEIVFTDAFASADNVSEAVSEFAVDMSNADKNDIITFSISGEKNNAEDTIYETVSLRNNIAINSALNIESTPIGNVKKVVLESNVFVYDGQPKTVTESNLDEDWVARGADSVLTATNAGTYTVTYKLKDPDVLWEDNSCVDLVYTWTIIPKSVTVNWGTTVWDYDESTHSTTCTITEGILEGDTCNVILTNNSVGVYPDEQTVTATLDNTNYVIKNETEKTLVINQIQCQVTNYPTAKTLTYDTSAQELVNAGTVTYGRFLYSFYQNTGYSATIPKKTNAGKYTVYYKYESTVPGAIIDENAGTPSSLSVTIDQATITTTLLWNSKEYTGNELSPIDTSIANVSWSGTTSASTIGKYAVRCSSTNSNYKVSNSYQSWQITTISVSILTKPKITTKLTYTGKPLNLITEGECAPASAAHYEYKVGNGSYSTDIPTATAKGSYKVYYKLVIDDENYSGTSYGYGTVKIQ